MFQLCKEAGGDCVDDGLVSVRRPCVLGPVPTTCAISFSL